MEAKRSRKVKNWGKKIFREPAGSHYIKSSREPSSLSSKGFTPEAEHGQTGCYQRPDIQVASWQEDYNFSLWVLIIKAGMGCCKYQTVSLAAVSDCIALLQAVVNHCGK